MGGRGGGLWRRLVYALPRPERESGRAGDGERKGGEYAWRTGAPPPFKGGTLVSVRADGTKETFERIRLLDWLDARLAARSCDRTERVESWGEAAARRAAEGSESARAGEDSTKIRLSDRDGSSDKSPETSAGEKIDDSLPFDFRCGFVGYLGYEMRAECDSPAPRHHSPVPDAALYFADRVVVVDHSNDDAYLLALVPDDIDIAGLERTCRGANLGAAARAVAEGMVAMARRRRRGTRVRGWRRRNGPCSRWGASTRRGAIHRRTKKATSEKRFDNKRGSDGGDWRASGRRAGRVRAHAPRGSHSRRSGAKIGRGSRLRVRGRVHVPPRPGRIRRRRAACQRAIDRGETYEVCLTNELARGTDGKRSSGGDGEVGGSIPAPATRRIRRRCTRCFEGPTRRRTPLSCASAAATLIRRTTYRRTMSDNVSSDPLADVVAVCCSSPERFLRLSASGVLEAKPIKGTAPRVQPLGCDADVSEASKLATSVKDRAENLMIVDLLRNDLGRVCVPGTVRVPGLMKIESYASVHQLVSTVRGTKRAGVPTAACVAAAFPPGSMTGAPKFRTVEIIDTLEPGPRGVYSGSVGYISVPRKSIAGEDAAGAFDLNVVIRTAVVKPGLRGGGFGSGAAARSPRCRTRSGSGRR